MVKLNSLTRRMIPWLCLAYGSAQASFVIPSGAVTSQNNLRLYDIQDTFKSPQLGYNLPTVHCNTYLTAFDIDFDSNAVFAGETNLKENHYQCNSSRAFMLH